MKILDVVSQLKSRLPILTDQFTDQVVITSITHVGTTATVVTNSAHGLEAGKAVNLSGARTPVVIASISHPDADGVATVTTSADHDLTMYSESFNLNFAEIEGATETEFNGTFNLLSVPNRRTFTMKVDAAAPVSVTGSPVLMNGSNYLQTIGGLYKVETVIDATTFTVEHTSAADLGSMVGEMTIRSDPRITGAIDVEVVIDSYTRDSTTDPADPTSERMAKPWCYVVMDDVTVSRGKTSRTDAVDTQVFDESWQQHILQRVRIIVVLPSADQTLGRNARDTSDDLLSPILRSLLGKRFAIGLASGESTPLQFVEHGLLRYDRARYFHEYTFEARELITFGDTVGAGDSVAFRDIEIQITPDVNDAANQGAGLVPIAVETSLDDEIL